MSCTRTLVINGNVYVRGGAREDNSDMYHICKYNPRNNKWTTLPPAPSVRFGIGKLNGKLVIVGGRNVEGVSRDVYVFEEDRQQWVKSNHPMPTGLTGLLALTHNTSLVVCGLSGESSPPSMFVYNSQSSQWHSKAQLPHCIQFGSSDEQHTISL